MIPYFTWETISLGPLTIQVWGLFVALGFLGGAFASAEYAKRRGLDSKQIYDVLGWIILGAIIFARLFHVFIYEPTYFLAHPSEISAFWDGGMSMFGGLLGACIAGIIFLRRRGLDFWKYANALVFGLPLGIFVGRLGCFFIHDHPGTATNFFLGVRYPDGVVRHDLGLYEFLFGISLFLIFWLFAKFRVRDSLYLPTFCITYGSMRFLADDLRLLDATYAGFTPAQYASVLLILIGAVLLYYPKKDE